MADGTESFVVAQNIHHFQKLLKAETNPDRRGLLLQLLTNELGKVAEPVQDIAARTTRTQFR